MAPRPYYRSPGVPRDVRSRLPRSCNGHAWSLEIDLPGKVPVWSGPAVWLTTLAEAAQTPQGAKVRKSVSVSLPTLLDVAACDARAADGRTGRNVKTAHATVAGILGCSAKQVQRARQVIEALGYSCTVVVGRYLTTQERDEAQARHGGHQVRMASHRACIMPRPGNVHLPRRVGLDLERYVRSHLPRRADALKGAAAPPAPTKKSPRRRSGSRPPLATQRLAAGLAQRLPWLARGHIGSLCHTLHCLGLDDAGWTVGDVLQLLEQRNVSGGLYSVPPGSQRKPLALFAFEMRHALEGVQEPPKLVRDRTREQLEAERAEQQRVQAARDAQLASERANPVLRARRAAAMQELRARLRAIPRPGHGSP